MHIASIFKTNKLLTRESATDLFKLIALKQASKIYVDFENINFISRSFADQFHKENYPCLKQLASKCILPIITMMCLQCLM
jgi:hypothetical protein